MTRSLTGIAFAFLVSLVATPPAVAAVFDQFDQDRHSRFGAVASPPLNAFVEANPNFLIDEGRISGVGLNQSVLITQRHYITADHASTSAPIFRGLDGIVRQYTTTGTGVQLTDTNGIGTDVRLYTLDAAIPVTEVRAIPVFTGFGADVVGREIIVKGSSNRFGRNVIDDVVRARFDNTATGRPTDVIEWTYNTTESGTTGLGADEIGLVGGDSGSAVLLELNGTLGVIGANFGIVVPDGVTPSATSDTYLSYASFLSSYMSDIDAITMSEGGFRAARLTVTAVPEPSSIALLGIIGSGIIGRRRLKRQRA